MFTIKKDLTLLKPEFSCKNPLKKQKLPCILIVQSASFHKDNTDALLHNICSSPSQINAIF